MNNNNNNNNNNNMDNNQNQNNNNQQQQQNTGKISDHKRSPSKDSINPITCPFPHTVKEAVAIAAGKKENSGDDDDGKTIRSNMLCYLYWLLVVLILGLISFTVWLSIQLARRHSEMNDSRKNFEFEDIFNTTFQPKSFDVVWVREDAYVHRTKSGCLYLYNVSRNSSEKLLDGSVFDEYKSNEFTLTWDLKYVILEFNVLRTGRYSRLSKYVIYDRHVKPGSSRISYFGQDRHENHEDIYNKQLQSVVLSPLTSAAVIVYNNNVFYQSSPKGQTRQLTFSGTESQIYNGANDWTYEGIFEKPSSIWWSPDSRYFCYLNINDTLVSKFQYIKRNVGSDDEIITLPHPKAYPSGNIPKITVRLVDTEQLKDEIHQAVLSPPDEIKNKDHYLVQMKWLNNTHVVIIWHNRPHNQSFTVLYDVVHLSSIILHYQISTNGWIEIPNSIVFFPSSTSYLTILPKLESDEAYWNHLAIVEQQELRDSKVTFLTSGLQEVLEIVGYNGETSEVFFTSTNGNQTRKHLFRHNQASGMTTCITCNETSGCQYVTVNFGPNAKHYILGCLGPKIPTYELKSVDSTKSVLLEDNKQLAEALSTKILPDKRHTTINVGNGQTATIEIIEPQEEGSKKFPLLIIASGEPGTNQVTDKFSVGWETYLASKEEIVVAKVDGRGSRGKSVTYKNMIHKKMTMVDVEDLQLAALFLKAHELVDPAKVSILGWGHSGLIAMHAVANDSDIFPCGISAGAILDLNYYDAPFFEKYMGLAIKSDNEQGYMNTDLMKKLTNLRTKKLALIQGLADDHIRHSSSANVMKTLEDNNILYRYQTYSDLSSYEMIPHRHAYHVMTEFLKNDCFAYFWKHDTKSWIMDKSIKKDKFRIKQFCV